jgi:Transposase
MDKAWAGVDAGKEFHWAHVLDASGTELLSRKVENDEADLSTLIDEALSLAEDVIWAVDQPGGSAALLLALLWKKTKGSSTFLASPWTGLATPTVVSPKLMRVMPMSLPTKRA